jgi:hypothetical protein
MSKNLTLKGAAFGALVALSVSAVAPASAAGLADHSYVTISATGGATNVLLNDTLDLKVNFASAVAGVDGRFLKVLVTDANSTSRVDATQTDSASAAITTSADLTAALVDDVSGDSVTTDDAVTITAPANSFSSGQKWIAYGATSTTATAATGVTDKAALNDFVYSYTSSTVVTRTLATLDADDSTVDEAGLAIENVAGKNSRAALLATSLGKSLETGYSLATAFGATALTNNRDTNGSYVVNTGVYQAGNDIIVRLANTSDATQTHTVTAWIDTNSNNIIDGTEYASEDTTVKFLKPSEVTPTVSIDPIGLNDTSIKAQATFSPELNMSQTSDVKISLTRQGFAEALRAAATSTTGEKNVFAASQVGTSKTWAATVGLYNTASNDPWTGTVPSAVADKTVTKTGTQLSFASVAHGLAVGDIVKVTNSTDSINNGYFTIISKTTDAFVIDIASATIADTTVHYTKSGTAAVAGTYSAQVSLGGVLVGSAVYQTTGTTSVAALANTVTVADGIAADGAVRTGLTSAITITSEATKSDTSAAASVPVLVTATSVSTAGTINVNGTKAAANGTWNLTTDAAGKIVLTVTNSSAKVNEAITLQVKTQGQTATTTLTWTDATYTLYDLNTSVKLSQRTIVEGGSYTAKFALLDQWKAAPTTGSYRLYVVAEDRAVSANYVTLTNGRADVSVTDAKIGASTYITLKATAQKLGTDGTTWSTVNSQAWTDTTANNASDDALKINVIKAQTDKITLDASAGSTYDFLGNDADNADFTAPIAAKATAAQNRAEAQGTQPAYGATNDLVIHGQVTNSVTGVARAGAVVTISGPSSLLFSIGGVDSFGSIKTVADENGKFTVRAYSNITQKDSVVTITTADGGTTTQKVTIEAPATSAGVSATITAKSIVPSGRTLPVSVKLVDKYGNAVDTDATDANGAIKVTVAGDLGWSTTIAAQTDDTGVISFQQILAPEDHGVLTVTVKYDSNGFAVTDVAGTTVAFTKTATVLVGVSSKITKAKNSTATVKNAKGATIKVVRGSKVATKVATSDNQKVTVKGGSGTVKVYVNDILVASKK